MRRHLIACAVTVVALGGTAVPARGQAKESAEASAAAFANPKWTPPKLSWGHPDLQGIWTSDDMRGIPTSRPASQAERESLTPEEFARRAGGDEASRDRAVNQETVLRIKDGLPKMKDMPKEMGGSGETLPE